MSRKLHAALALTAVISFGLYILGCVGYAAWNADGTKLLVPYYAPQSREWGVALQSLKTGSTTSVLVQPNVAWEDLFMQAQWVDGHTQPFVLVLRKEDGTRHLDAYLLPRTPGEPIRSWLLPEPKNDYPVAPFAELDGKIYMTGSYVAVLNLRDGSKQVKQYEDAHAQPATFGTDGTRLFYVRGVSRPAPTPEKPDATDDGIQFGEMKLTDLSEIRFFDLWMSDLKSKYGFGTIPSNLAIERGGARFAITADRENEGRSAIVILNNAGIERVFFPQMPMQDCRLSNLEWPSSGTMYAAALCPISNDIAQLAVAEISANDGRARLTPLIHLNTDSEFYDYFEVGVKSSLSLDGRTLAVTTTALEDKDVTRDNRAIFLVDLKSPERAITKIPVPAPVKAAAAER